MRRSTGAMPVFVRSAGCRIKNGHYDGLIPAHGRDRSESTVTEELRKFLRRVARAILLTVAILYFLIDLIFLSVIRPLRRRIMALKWVGRSREWVGKLNRYMSLVLLLVPWLILEPIKPIGFLLVSHKHHLAATLLIVGGEVVKLTLFEQLFDMTSRS